MGGGLGRAAVAGAGVQDPWAERAPLPSRGVGFGGVPPGVILFVEVKTRRSEAYGRPLGAVGRRKRGLLRRSDTKWLARARLLGTETRYRFDAGEGVGSPGKGVPRMRWVRGLEMAATRAPDFFTA